MPVTRSWRCRRRHPALRAAGVNHEAAIRRDRRIRGRRRRRSVELGGGGRGAKRPMRRVQHDGRRRLAQVAILWLSDAVGRGDDAEAVEQVEQRHGDAVDRRRRAALERDVDGGRLGRPARPRCRFRGRPGRQRAAARPESGARGIVGGLLRRRSSSSPAPARARVSAGFSASAGERRRSPCRRPPCAIARRLLDAGDLDELSARSAAAPSGVAIGRRPSAQGAGLQRADDVAAGELVADVERRGRARRRPRARGRGPPRARRPARGRCVTATISAPCRSGEPGDGDGALEPA